MVLSHNRTTTQMPCWKVWDHKYATRILENCFLLPQVKLNTMKFAIPFRDITSGTLF